jgi:hypothetical protein
LKGKANNLVVEVSTDGDTPLGQQVDDDTKTLLLMTNASNSVLGESQQAKYSTANGPIHGERNVEVGRRQK